MWSVSFVGEGVGDVRRVAPTGAAAGDGAATGIAGVRAAARSEVRRDRGGVAGPPSPPTGIMRRGRPSKRL